MKTRAYKQKEWGIGCPGVICWALCAVTLLSGMTGMAQTLESVRFMPHWVPQAQFAGFYMAQQKGFYLEEGLSVEMLTGGPGRDPMQALAAGELDVGTTFLSSALKVRAEGTPVVNIGQIVQRSALLLVTRASSGIESPADMDGKIVTLWTFFDVQPRALFRKFNVNPIIIPQLYSFNLFLRGGADVVSAMWYNEYHQLLNSGINDDELRVFRYEEYGLNFPEDGVYCTERLLKERPEVCRRFVKAALKGWLYAFEHQEETLDVIMERVQAAKVPTTRVHQRWMLAKMKDLVMPNGQPSEMGQLPEAEYQRVAESMRDAGLLKDVVPYKQFYENCAE